MMIVQGDGGFFPLRVSDSWVILFPTHAPFLPFPPKRRGQKGILDKSELLK